MPRRRGSTRHENCALLGASRDGRTPDFAWCGKPDNQIGVALLHAPNSARSADGNINRRVAEVIIAIAHSMAVAIYHILKDKTAYRELGADFFDKLNPTRIVNRLTKRIQNLGFQVQVSPIPAAA